MGNLYVTPAAIREALKLDTQNAMSVSLLEPLIESCSRWLDNELGRHFYVQEEARYYDGPGGVSWWLDDDVISITTLKWDGNDDGTYETTLTENTDFLGWPYNGEHYRRLDVLTRRSSLIDSWPLQPKALELTGKFGWSDETEALVTSAGAAITGTVADTTSTTISTSGDPTTNLDVGHTVRIESEQLYVTAVAANSFTAERGVNGTTAAAHSAKAIGVFQYPRPLVTAMKAEVTRWYREFATGFAGQLIQMSEGTQSSFRATWPAILSQLGTYRHPATLVSI